MKPEAPWETHSRKLKSSKGLGKCPEVFLSAWSIRKHRIASAFSVSRTSAARIKDFSSLWHWKPQDPCIDPMILGFSSNSYSFKFPVPLTSSAFQNYRVASRFQNSKAGVLSRKSIRQSKRADGTNFYRIPNLTILAFCNRQWKVQLLQATSNYAGWGRTSWWSHQPKQFWTCSSLNRVTSNCREALLRSLATSCQLHKKTCT